MKATVETLQRFLRLPRRERRIVLAAAVALAATRLGLAFTSFRQWRQMLGWLAPAQRECLDQKRDELAQRAREIVRLGEAAARNLPWRANCLEQTLVLEWLLRRHRIAGTLRIGGRKDGDRFEAHAWVEFDGEILSGMDTAQTHYAPFEEQSAALRTEAS